MVNSKFPLPENATAFSDMLLHCGCIHTNNEETFFSNLVMSAHTAKWWSSEASSTGMQVTWTCSSHLPEQQGGTRQLNYTLEWEMCVIFRFVYKQCFIFFLGYAATSYIFTIFTQQERVWKIRRAKEKLVLRLRLIKSIMLYIYVPL